MSKYGEQVCRNGLSDWKGGSGFKPPLPGSRPAAKKVNILVSNEEYYTDFQLFPDISDVVEDNDNYKIMVLIMNTKSGEKELITILPASHLSNCFI